MKVKGFYHVLLVGHWYTVVSEQMRILLTSGLYNECEEINVCCLGSESELKLFGRLFLHQYPKLIPRYYSENVLEYEFPALKMIEVDRSEYVGFYFHAKGVTKPSDTLVNHWRSWLNEAILNRWRQHRDNVEGEYDVSGVNYLEPPLHPRHFSGNFWWFNRAYINKLPNIDSLNKSHRWDAEQWICRGSGTLFAGEFKESGIDLFTIQTIKP